MHLPVVNFPHRNIFLLPLNLLFLLSIAFVSTQAEAEISERPRTPYHPRSGDKMADTESYWGLHDSVATIGKLFRYSLIYQDSEDMKNTGPSNQHYYQMAAEQEKALPSWMHWNKESNTLEGVAAADQKDQLTVVRVTHFTSSGKDVVASSVESFTVKVVDSEEDEDGSFQRYEDRAARRTPTIQCDKLSSSTQASVLIDAKLTDLSGKDRVDLLEILSAYLNISVTDFRIHPGDFQPTWKEDALVAGPGDTIKPTSPPGLLIQWKVGCGSVLAPHMKVLEQLESKAKNGDLGKAVGYGILGWHVTNRRGLSRGRTRRQLYLHPQPTPTPSLLHPTGYPQATRVPPQDLPWSVWLRPQLEILITTKSSGMKPPTRLTEKPSHSLSSSSSEMIKPTRITERGHVTSVSELYPSHSGSNLAAGKVNGTKSKDAGDIEPSMVDISSTVVVPTASLPDWSRRSTRIDSTTGSSTVLSSSQKPDDRVPSTSKSTKKPRTKKISTSKVTSKSKSVTRSQFATPSLDKSWDIDHTATASLFISDKTQTVPSSYDVTQISDNKYFPSSKYPQSGKESFEETTKQYYSSSIQQERFKTSSIKLAWSTAEFVWQTIQPDSTIKHSETSRLTLYPDTTNFHQFTSEAALHPDLTSEQPHTTGSVTYHYSTTAMLPGDDWSLLQPSGTTGYPHTDESVVHPSSSQGHPDTDWLERTVSHIDGAMGQPSESVRYPYTVESTDKPPVTAIYEDIHKSTIFPGSVSIYPSTDEPVFQPAQSTTRVYSEVPATPPEDDMKNFHTDLVLLEETTKSFYPDELLIHHPEDSTRYPHVDVTSVLTEEMRTEPLEPQLYPEIIATPPVVPEKQKHDEESMFTPEPTTRSYPVDGSDVQSVVTGVYQPGEAQWDRTTRGSIMDDLTSETMTPAVYPSDVTPDVETDKTTSYSQDIEPSYAVDLPREYPSTVHPSATSDHIWTSKDPHVGDFDQPGWKATQRFDDKSTMAYPTIESIKPHHSTSIYQTPITLHSTTILPQDVASSRTLRPTTQATSMVASSIHPSSPTKVSTTSIYVITTEKHHMSTTSDIEVMDNGPRLVNPLAKLEVEAGRLLWFKIPRFTFVDDEDGSTENLKLLRLMYEDQTTVQPNSWIKLNESSQTLYGLPLNDHAGKYNFIVAALDSDSHIAKSPLEVVVKKSTTNDKINHEFSIKLDVDYNKFKYDVDTRLAVLNQLAKAFGDSDSSKITVTGISEGSVVIRWTNNTLPTDHCPREIINALRDIMLLPNDSVNQTFARAMSPYIILSASGETLGVCDLNYEDHAPTTTDLDDLLTPQFEDPREPARKEVPTSSNYLLYIIIAIIILLILILIVVIILCFVCYKKRRARNEKQRNGDKLGGANKGIPIIFADELEDQSGVMEEQDDVASPGSTLKSVKSNRNSDPISTVPPPEYSRSKPGSASSTLRSDWKAPLLGEHEDLAEEDQEGLRNASRCGESGDPAGGARNTSEREISNSDTLPAR